MAIENNEGVRRGTQAGQSFEEILRRENGFLGGLLEASAAVAGGW
jgi:hypothetical protein